MFEVLSKESTAAIGNRRALFERLMAQSYRPAYTLAYRLAGNAAEAEDLVQEAFVRAFKFFHRYDESLPFSNWLYRIISNTHLDSVRRRGRIKTTSLDQPVANGSYVAEVADLNACPDKEMLNTTMSEHVESALMTMTPEFRQAVILADIEGMPYDEIADVMHTSVGTVRSRIHRGRKQLRKQLVDRNSGGKQ